MGPDRRASLHKYSPCPVPWRPSLGKKATDEREKGEVKPEGEEESEEMAEETEEQSVEIKIENIEDKETEHEKAKRRKRGNNTQ